MNTKTTTQSRSLGQRLFSLARALLAVSALAALAVSTAHASVVFTRSTASGEHWARYTATYTAPYTGNYTLGFNVTAGQAGDNSIFLDVVKVKDGTTTVFADSFGSPALAANAGVSYSPSGTNGTWAFTHSSGLLNGSPPNWGLAGAASTPSPTPFTLGPSTDGTSQFAFLQAVGGNLPNMTTTVPLVAGQTYTIEFDQGSRYDFGGATTYTVTLDLVIPNTLPTVYKSGTSAVIGFDPIFLNGPVVPDYNESKPVPTVGYNDPRWTNPHTASIFPLGTHPWEGTVPYNFTANWINAWAGGGQLNTNPGLDSNRHGKTTSSSGWAGYPYYGVPNQSFTKYSTTVYGEGEFVLQFLADNVSWIYVDSALVGYQDYWWGTSGTGRYLISLTGAGAHDLGFVIWDGGGLAGGKFRLETRASFEANNPGVALPPRAATVTLSNLTHTYNGSPKSATVTTGPAGLATSVTYNGSTTAPTNVGSYQVVATVTSPGYSGSATGTLTIGKATATVTLANLEHTYDGTVKSATATTSPTGLNLVFNYGPGARINAGSYTVQAVVDNPNYTGSTTGSLEIKQAEATFSVTGYTGTYDAAPHGATGSATGVGGVSLPGLNLGASFTDTPGGTATWTFSGGTNYHDATGTAAIVIAKADPTIVVTPYTVTYDSTAKTATGSATGVKGETLSGLDLSATTHTNAGTTSDAWTFTDVTGNYNDARGSVTNTIDKAPSSTLVTITGAPFTYTGSAQTPASVSVTGVGGLSLTPAASYANNTNAGTATASYTYAGDANHTASSDSKSFTIDKAPSTTVVTITGAPFTYTGSAQTPASVSVTGAGGLSLAPAAGYANNTNAGTATASYTYAGDANHNGSSDSKDFTIAKSPTQTTLGAVPTIQAVGQPVTLTATVVFVAPGGGVPNGTVTFNLGTTVLGSGTVNSSGVATLTTTAIPLGPQSITATYSGSSNYLTSTSNAVSILIYGYPTGGGTFVIGDGNATLNSPVNFWGSQWEKTNSLSGGSSNASFKGFATGPTPPAVGGTFTAAPGNSGPSPASVPAYLGVIVTSKVTKSGSNVTGTIVGLVVVKTNPGYAGSPGNPGTGTIVAVIR